jgi:hypothetical protein
MTVEWMPIKPCKKCPNGDGYSFADCSGDDYILDCSHHHAYKTAILYQKKLLEYLKKEHYLGASVIDPMLKELEEHNG